MSGIPEDKQVIQSYIFQKWMVSTIHRQSSALMYDPPWFYETIVWEWDGETRTRGKIVHEAGCDTTAEHFAICQKLLSGESLRE